MKTLNPSILKIYSAVILVSMVFLCTIYHHFLEQWNTTGSNIEDKVVLADACTLAGSCVYDVVLIRGAINKGTLKAYAAFMAEHKSIPFKYVCFDSPGGFIEESYSLATAIGGRLGTCLAEQYRVKEAGVKQLNQNLSPTKCASSCNFILMSNRNRLAIGSNLNFIAHSVGATISFCFCTSNIPGAFFHSYRTKNFIADKSNHDRDEHLAFINFSGSIPNSSQYKLSQDELKKYAVFNHWIN